MPRKRWNDDESTHQRALFKWAALQAATYPELNFMFHPPNGGYRRPQEAARLTGEGVKKGVPDVILPAPRKGFTGLAIELKYGKGKTSKHQDEWIEFLRSENWKCEVIYDWEIAAKCIGDYLK